MCSLDGNAEELKWKSAAFLNCIIMKQISKQALKCPSHAGSSKRCSRQLMPQCCMKAY